MQLRPVVINKLKIWNEKEKKQMAILFLAYWAAGYWAVNRTVYANKVVVYSKPGSLFVQKSIYALIGGWLLIPVALVKKIIGH